MRKIIATSITLLAAGLGSACTTEAYQRNQGVTSYAGNAIAANTAMQMVDPWPEGVEDTDLVTPVERPKPAEPDGPMAASAPATTGSSN